MTQTAVLEAAPAVPSLDKAQAYVAERHQLYIDGRWVPAASGQSFETFNPANGKAIATIASAQREDADRAVKAARSAFEGKEWADMKPSRRAQLLWRLSDLIEANADEIAAIETLDNGMPVGDARGFHIPYAIEQLRYNSGWPTKLTGESIPLSGMGNWHAYTLRQPVGVVALIVPWNAPFAMAVAKVAAALAAGCTVILKPAEETPLSAIRLTQLIEEAGFPKGVFNLLTGFGETAGAALAEHPDVDKVSFTGSTEVGRIIIRAAAGNFKRVTLELGGKTPTIILPDADMSAAAVGAARSIFNNAGQICNAGSRLYVHERHFDEVIEGISNIAKSIKLGPGLEKGTQMGPVISGKQRERIQGYVKAGVNDGAQVHVGGNEISGEGYFVSPTVLTGTHGGMSVVQEEIFGPVLCAMTFSDDDLDRLAAEANSTEYGLGATIWTRNLSAAHTLARKLKAGTVRINGGGLDPALPFGGFKHSGWGRENGREGIEAFTELKSVGIAL